MVMETSGSAEQHPCFLGAGEVRTLMRCIDWKSSPVGDPARWPRELQSTLNTLLDSRQPMALWWGHERVAFCNDAFEALLGPDCSAAMLGNPARQTATRVWDIFGAEVEQVLESEDAVWHDAVEISWPSKRRQVWCYGISPVREGRVVRGALLTCTDITVHHARSLDSQRAERALVEAMEDAFVVVELLYDHMGRPVDFRWLDANPAHTVHTGLDNVIGQLGSQRIGTLNPDLLRHAHEAVVSGWRTRFTLRSEALQRSFHWCVVPVGYAGENKVAAIVRDVTADMSIQAALRESEARAAQAARRAEAESAHLAAVLQAVPVPIVSANSVGAVQPKNQLAREQWGPEFPENVAGYDAWRGWWPSGTANAGKPVAAHEWPLARALAGTSPVAELLDFDDPKRGERVSLLISAAAIRDSSGAINGAVAAAMDLTELVRAKAALEDLDHRKDHFLYMLAHELRNPLAPIRSIGWLLKSDGLSHDKKAHAAEIIERQVTNIVSLVDDLNDVSRVMTGQLTIKREVVNLQKILTHAVEQVLPLVQTKHHSLHWSPPSETVYVVGDAQRLVQVFTNLLINSVRYTPERGEVWLSMETDETSIRVSVRDNGIGMAPDLIPRVFELFVQGKPSADRQNGGLGMGLALVKSLVQLHGGAVEASSPGEGQGSCFVVTLPRLASEGGQNAPTVARC